MISFVKKTDTHPTLKQVEENRFEQIRKAAAGAVGIRFAVPFSRRRARQKAEDNRLI